MDALPLKPETASRLEDLAKLRGQDPVELGGAALDDWLAREREEFDDACRGIEQGHSDFREGRSTPAQEALGQLRHKYGIPR